FPASGFSDILGRIVAQKLSESVGQPVVNDNRPGASGNIGAEMVAKAQPDGYTLLINAFNYVINPNAMALSFDPLNDFAAISLIADGPPQVVAVGASSPFRSVQEIIAAARAKPAQLNFATAGIGTSPHLAVELLRSMTGIDVVMIPYKGSVLAVSAVVSGEIAVTIPNLPIVLPLLKSGKLRGLAVTSARRSASVPELPTMIESGFPGFEMSGFLGLLAPLKTPRSVIQKLNSEMVALAKQRDFIDRLDTFGMQPVGSTPEAFERFMREQIAKWGRVFKSAGK
ncbi:MAG TPA: tripartite tricarboxylate transporter substrate binding protein, partial [Burkholderiales bacterium]|nr:tripartite tricarboxylate transporter substrate binding protein [Burkholderiales bacterium]